MLRAAFTPRASELWIASGAEEIEWSGSSALASASPGVNNAITAKIAALAVRIIDRVAKEGQEDILIDPIIVARVPIRYRESLILL
jgi:hypothetical protein